MRAVITAWCGSFGFAKRFGGGEFYVAAEDVEVGTPAAGAIIRCDAVPDAQPGERHRPRAKHVKVMQ